MQAWVKYREWQKWCWNGGDFDADYFDPDTPVTVIDISEVQPFGGETLYKITQNNQGTFPVAYIPIQFISLEFYDNLI